MKQASRHLPGTSKAFYYTKPGKRSTKIIEYLVLIITALLIVVLLILGITRQPNRDTRQRKGRGDSLRDGHGPVVFPDLPSPVDPSNPQKSRNPRDFHRCPLCGSVLEKHEKVKSVLYPGKPDGMMEIYGCPYCYGPKAKKERLCPVCAKPLPEGGMVFARFFQTADRKHAHVLGCSDCYTRRTHP